MVLILLLKWEWLEMKCLWHSIDKMCQSLKFMRIDLNWVWYYVFFLSILNIIKCHDKMVSVLNIIIFELKYLFWFEKKEKVKRHWHGDMWSSQVVRLWRRKMKLNRNGTWKGAMGDELIKPASHLIVSLQTASCKKWNEWREYLR